MSLLTRIGALAGGDLFRSFLGVSFNEDGTLRSVAGSIQVKVIDDTTILTTGDGQFRMLVSADLNGLNLIAVAAYVTTVSSSGLPTVQIRRTRGGSDVDMLSTKVSIDANEISSYDATTPAVIDLSKDDVVTGDLISVDVDIAGTGAKGLGVIFNFG